MASYVSSQGVGESLFCPSEGENARVRHGERRPVGGGLISRPSVPLLSCFPLAILSQAGGGGGWLWGRVGERGSAVGLGRAGGEGAPPDAA